MTDYNALFKRATARLSKAESFSAKNDSMGFKKEVFDLLVALKAAGKIGDFEVDDKIKVTNFRLSGNPTGAQGTSFVNAHSLKMTISVKSLETTASIEIRVFQDRASVAALNTLRDRGYNIRGGSMPSTFNHVKSKDDFESILEDISVVAMVAAKRKEDPSPSADKPKSPEDGV